VFCAKSKNAGVDAVVAEGFEVGGHNEEKKQQHLTPHGKREHLIRF
jgi:NAD(P)H-dependent flavin oxidoreductase YrpB (nitropropane dioxygenase family)